MKENFPVNIIDQKRSFMIQPLFFNVILVHASLQGVHALDKVCSPHG